MHLNFPSYFSGFTSTRNLFYIKSNSSLASFHAIAVSFSTHFGSVLIGCFISPQIAYAAVDCTKGQNHDICKQEGVEGYPTFNYYNYGKFVEKYSGDRGVSVRRVPAHFDLMLKKNSPRQGCILKYKCTLVTSLYLAPCHTSGQLKNREEVPTYFCYCFCAKQT